MINKILKFRSIVQVALLILLAVPFCAAADTAPTEAQVKTWASKSTMIRGCGADTYNFKQLQIAPPVKRDIDYGQKATQVYPIHINYAVQCTYGDEEMNAEVDLTFYLYRDAFGAWKNVGPNFDEDQNWDDTQNQLRCRAQSVAHLTLTPDGKVSGRTPAKDKGFIGCSVIPKTDE
jgi:hypothetical protein